MIEVKVEPNFYKHSQLNIVCYMRMPKWHPRNIYSAGEEVKLMKLKNERKKKKEHTLSFIKLVHGED